MIDQIVIIGQKVTKIVNLKYRAFQKNLDEQKQIQVLLVQIQICIESPAF
jgi:hypothetical protein